MIITKCYSCGRLIQEGEPVYTKMINENGCITARNVCADCINTCNLLLEEK